MNKLNKYWNLSGGLIFDYYDKIAHKEAIKEIWECVTSSAEVKFLVSIDFEEKLKTNIEIEALMTWNSYTIIKIESVYFYWIFTFIKKKQWKK